MTTKWNGVLWTANNQRSPACAAFDATLRDGGSGDDIFTACRENPLGVALYHIPTIEWIDGLAAWIERAAHGGFLKSALATGSFRIYYVNASLTSRSSRRTTAPGRRRVRPPVVEAGDLGLYTRVRRRRGCFD